MGHPFVRDENGLGCDECPLPKSHPIHEAPPTAAHNAGGTPPAPVASVPDVAPMLPNPDNMGVQVTPDQADTSQAAALRAWPRAGSARWLVLQDLDVAGDNGCTDEDLAFDLDLDLNTIRPRRGELVTGGWVTQARDHTGAPLTRPTAKGNDATVWVLTPAARHHIDQEARTLQSA